MLGNYFAGFLSPAFFLNITCFGNKTFVLLLFVNLVILGLHKDMMSSGVPENMHTRFGSGLLPSVEFNPWQKMVLEHFTGLNELSRHAILTFNCIFSFKKQIK